MLKNTIDSKEVKLRINDGDSNNQVANEYNKKKESHIMLWTHNEKRGTGTHLITLGKLEEM